MPVPFPHRPAAKYKAVTQYSSPSGAGDSLFGVPSVFIDQEKKPKAGWVGEAWYMNVLDQFQRASKRHAFRTYVLVVDVAQVRQRSVGISSDGVVDGLRVRVAMEQLLERGTYLLGGLLLGMSGFQKWIAIALGRKGAGSTGWGLDRSLRRRRGSLALVCLSLPAARSGLRDGARCQAEDDGEQEQAWLDHRLGPHTLFSINHVEIAGMAGPLFSTAPAAYLPGDACRVLQDARPAPKFEDE